MTFIDMDDWDRNCEAEAGVDYVKMDLPIVVFHRDTDFNPSSDFLLRADNRTGLLRPITMICSPGWIHQPRLHHTRNDLLLTTCSLIHNMRPTFTDDDVMYSVSRAERRLEHDSLTDRGDKEGINNGDMQPKLLDGTPERWTKRQNFLWNRAAVRSPPAQLLDVVAGRHEQHFTPKASWLARTTTGWLARIVIYHTGYHRSERRRREELYNTRDYSEIVVIRFVQPCVL